MQNSNLKVFLTLIVILLATFSFSYGLQVTRKAVGLIKKGMYEEAVLELKEIILKKPEKGEAHYLLGKAHLLLGKEEFALESFDRSIVAEKKDKKRLSLAYQDLGTKYALEYGELELAERLFDYAVLIEPKAKRKIVKILLDESEETRRKGGYFTSKLLRVASQYLEDHEIKSALIFDIERLNQRETINAINLLADTIKKYIKDIGIVPHHNGNLTAYSLFYSALMPYMPKGGLVAFDCWENPFYIISGEPNKQDFLIISSGRDGIREDSVPEEMMTFICTELSDFNNDMILKNGNWIKIPKSELFKISSLISQ